MFKIIINRILQAIPSIFALVTVSFFLMRLAPGSPFAGEKNLAPEILANLEAKYHLNDPLLVQYGNYWLQLLRGDFGPSFKYKDSTVNELLAQSFPISLELGLYAFIISVVIGITLGVIAALKQNTKTDVSVMALAMTGIVVPSFVKAPLMVLLFAVILKWLPAGGWNDGKLENMILPVTALFIAYVASIARTTRGSMIEVMHSPFIRTARAKGVPLRRIIFKHALRPAMIPVVTFLGPAFVGIITGSIIIESVFGLPGVGQLFVNGAMNRDYNLVLSLTIIVGVLTIVFNAIVDIIIAFLDPRIEAE